MAGAEAVASNEEFLVTPPGKGIVGRVLQSKKPELRHDLMDKDSGYYFVDAMREAGWRSMAAVPLLLGAQPIGVLACYTGRPHFFDQNELCLLTSFARLATIAFNNELLFEQQEKKQKLLGTVLRLMSEEASAEDRLSTYNNLLYELMNETGAELGAIHRVDYEKRVVTPLVQRHYPDEYETTTHPIGEGSIVGWVAATKQSVLINDIEEELQWKENYYQGMKSTRSELAAPIIDSIADRVVGVINLESPRPNAFRPSHRQLLDSLTVYPHIILQQPHLKRRLQESIEEQEAIDKAIGAVANASIASLRRETLLQSILHEAIKVCGGHLGAVHLLEDKTLIFAAGWPASKEKVLQQKTDRLHLKQKSIIARTVRVRWSQLVPDVSQDEDFLDVDGTSGSELCVYISNGEGILGTLNVEHPDPYALTERHRETLIKLSNLIAVALRIADYAEQARRMEELHELAVASRVHTIWLHELTTLAGHTKGSLENVEREIKSGRTRFIEQEIKNAYNKLDALLQQLKRKWEPEAAEQLDVSSLLRQKTPVFATRWEDIDFLTKLDETAGAHVLGQPTALTDVIERIVENAVRAIREARIPEPTIELLARRDGSMLEIRIADNGHGIPEKMLAQMGEITFAKTKGSGRGSRIAALIIRNHFNGDIWWERNTPQGTVAVIQLPILENKQ
jgi:GAF domain-containing protein